jgi:hypothetical protein
MGLEGSLPCSQEPSTRLHPQSNYSAARTLSVRSTLMLSIHLRLDYEVEFACLKIELTSNSTGRSEKQQKSVPVKQIEGSEEWCLLGCYTVWLL